MNDESTEHSGAVNEIECPRCGYDVAILRPREWADLVGTCPECGYGLDWTAIDSQQSLPWFIEGKGDGRGVWSRWWRTTIKVLIARPFFAEVRLEKPVVLRRAFMWTAILFLVLQLVYGVAVLSRRMASYVPAIPTRPGVAAWRVAPLEDVVGWIVSEFTAPAIVVEFQPTTGWPPKTEWAKSVWQHLDFTGSIEFPIWTTQMCTLTIGAGPVTLATRVVWAVIVSTPIVLMCLPWTRRRAKVRVTHVIRATVYSLAAFVPLIVGRMVIEVGVVSPTFGTQLGLPGGSAGFDTQSNFWLVVVAICSIFWIWRWWAAVLNTHWKLTEAFAVLLSVMVIQCLLVSIILTMRFNHWFPNAWMF